MPQTAPSVSGGVTAVNAARQTVVRRSSDPSISIALVAISGIMISSRAISEAMDDGRGAGAVTQYRGSHDAQSGLGRAYLLN